MFHDGKAVLHIVDIATHLSAATFLDSNGSHFGQSVQGIWLSFVMTGMSFTQGIPTDSVLITDPHLLPIDANK